MVPWLGVITSRICTITRKQGDGHKIPIVHDTVNYKLEQTWGNFIRDGTWKMEPLCGAIAELIHTASHPEYRMWKNFKTGRFYTTEEVPKANIEQTDYFVMDYSCPKVMKILMTVHERASILKTTFQRASCRIRADLPPARRLSSSLSLLHIARNTVLSTHTWPKA